MKGSKLYILFIVLLLAVLIAAEYNMPKNFVWEPTFSQYDKQPFGAAIFDDVVLHSLPHGYTVENKTFFQLEQDSLQHTAILVVDEYLRLDRVDVESIYRLLEKGNKVMLVAKSFGYVLEDTLNVQTDPSHFYYRGFKEWTQRQKDTIVWEADSVFPQQLYRVYMHIRGSDFYPPDSLTTVRAKVSYNDSVSWPVAMQYSIGSGELYLVTTPFMFTNYGMLDGDNSGYIFRLLTQMQGMPLIRTEAYNHSISTEPQTPLRYFLSQPPLRWGIYLTLLTLLLFMIFTAKRRQRAIPVVNPPTNKSLEFIELIGTLYFQKKESATLIRKKYIFFAETLRRTLQVDLDDGGDDAGHARMIASKTGIEEEKISRLLISLRRVIESKNPYMTDNLMKEYIDRMNEINMRS